MLKIKKKEKETVSEELNAPLGSSNETAKDDSEASVTAPKTETSTAQAEAVKVPAKSTGDNELAMLTNTLNAEFKKAGNGLTAQIAKVSNNLTYVLIKAANSAYCFARIGSGQEGSRASQEIEFLSNVPSEAHRQIFEICKSLNISDSKRLFFHPSGIL